jgi:N-acetylmuramoyl-L-alanine amidase
MKKQFLALATILTLSAGGFATNIFAAEHNIQQGETLSEISTKYSMTVEQLKQLNDLSADIIFANDTLKVLDEKDLYTVQQGDTLHEIANAYNVAMDQLAKWNNLVNPNLIYVGEKLAVTAEAGELLQQIATVAQVPEQEKQNATSQQEPEQQNQAPEQQQQAPSQSQQPQGNTITMSATAYTAYCTGCSGITANGTDLRSNPELKVIAVDPSVIPLGTRVFVEGYGEAIAADTGGAIKGNKIDVFIPTQEDALNWGRQTVQVTILN